MGNLNMDTIKVLNKNIKVLNENIKVLNKEEIHSYYKNCLFFNKNKIISAIRKKERVYEIPIWYLSLVNPEKEMLLKIKVSIFVFNCLFYTAAITLIMLLFLSLFSYNFGEFSIIGGGFSLLFLILGLFMKNKRIEKLKLCENYIYLHKGNRVKNLKLFDDAIDSNIINKSNSDD